MFMLAVGFLLCAVLMDNYVDLQDRHLNLFMANLIHLKDKQQILIIPITFYLGAMHAFVDKNLAIFLENSIDVQSVFIVCIFTLAGLACFVIFSRFLPLNFLSILAILLNYLTLILMYVFKDYGLIYHLKSYFKIFSSKFFYKINKSF